MKEAETTPVAATSPVSAENGARGAEEIIMIYSIDHQVRLPLPPADFPIAVFPSAAKIAVRFRAEGRKQLSLRGLAAVTG